MMSPSTGMRSPGSTLTMSPGLMLLVGTMAKSISGAYPACDGSSRDAGFMTMRDWAGISLASVWRSATGKKGYVRYSNTRESAVAFSSLHDWGQVILGASIYAPAVCTVLKQEIVFLVTSASLLQVVWPTQHQQDMLTFVMHVVDLGQMPLKICTSARMSTPAASKLVKLGTPASAVFCPAESRSA